MIYCHTQSEATISFLNNILSSFFLPTFLATISSTYYHKAFENTIMTHNLTMTIAKSQLCTLSIPKFLKKSIGNKFLSIYRKFLSFIEKHWEEKMQIN